ncbi:hypothetical protein SAMN04488010_1195 [Maribacter stanieri]|uniref:Uncharacterized protein n=1 Tax=Maribacter stanieri TaxID=440514 RepID=A0A1I6I6E1_9FLAO|nr:hypothetical protein SAMN04488010_1195 [Maribacter stanieri]
MINPNYKYDHQINDAILLTLDKSSIYQNIKLPESRCGDVTEFLHNQYDIVTYDFNNYSMYIITTYAGMPCCQMLVLNNKIYLEEYRDNLYKYLKRPIANLLIDYISD